MVLNASFTKMEMILFFLKVWKKSLISLCYKSLVEENKYFILQNVMETLFFSHIIRS